MKLYYFDAHGRAEPIRCLLHIAGVPFEDIRMDHETFQKHKADGTFEFGQVPAIEYEGKIMS